MFMKFRTQYNVQGEEDFPGKYEVNELPSETIPDQTMTIREIYQRYANGQPLSLSQRELSYEGTNPSLPLDWDKMDISERYEFAAQHKIKLTDLQRRINEEKEEKEAKDLEDAIRTKILSEMEAQKTDKEEPK